MRVWVLRTGCCSGRKVGGVALCKQLAQRREQCVTACSAAMDQGHGTLGTEVVDHVVGAVGCGEVNRVDLSCTLRRGAGVKSLL
jgi:hypothetical protein